MLFLQQMFPAWDSSNLCFKYRCKFELCRRKCREENVKEEGSFELNFTCYSPPWQYSHPWVSLGSQNNDLPCESQPQSWTCVPWVGQDTSHLPQMVELMEEVIVDREVGVMEQLMLAQLVHQVTFYLIFSSRWDARWWLISVAKGLEVWSIVALRTHSQPAFPGPSEPKQILVASSRF